MTTNRDPSPEEIAAECLLIQAGWSADEKMKRLRVDLRPQFALADGRRGTMASDDYEGHHATRAELQAMADP